MKLVVPTEGDKGLNDNVAEHFGRCFSYTFLNDQGEVIEIINNVGEHKVGDDQPPQLIKKHGAEILLCRDIGPKAFNLCHKLGINVYISQADKVTDIFRFWLDGKLEAAGRQED